MTANENRASVQAKKCSVSVWVVIDKLTSSRRSIGQITREFADTNVSSWSSSGPLHSHVTRYRVNLVLLVSEYHTTLCVICRRVETIIIEN